MAIAVTVVSRLPAQTINITGCATVRIGPELFHCIQRGPVELTTVEQGQLFTTHDRLIAKSA